MQLFDVVLDLEQIELKSWSLSSLILALNDAIVEGPNDASNFHGALHAIFLMSKEVEEELSLLTKKTFKACKEQKGDE